MVLLSRKLEHVPQLLILEVPAEREPCDQVLGMKGTGSRPAAHPNDLLGHRIRLLHGLLTHQRSDDWNKQSLISGRLSA